MTDPLEPQVSLANLSTQNSLSMDSASPRSAGLAWDLLVLLASTGFSQVLSVVCTTQQLLKYANAVGLAASWSGALAASKLAKLCVYISVKCIQFV